jgi:ATP-dependent Clp protease ATP-binding subunit ClpX
MKKKTGARGLRSIMEKVMLDVMYEIPALSNVKECVVSEEVIVNRDRPILIYEEEAEIA